MSTIYVDFARNLVPQTVNRMIPNHKKYLIETALQMNLTILTKTQCRVEPVYSLM